MLRWQWWEQQVLFSIEDWSFLDLGEPYIISIHDYPPPWGLGHDWPVKINADTSSRNPTALQRSGTQRRNLYIWALILPQRERGVGMDAGSTLESIHNNDAGIYIRTLLNMSAWKHICFFRRSPQNDGIRFSFQVWLFLGSVLQQRESVIFTFSKPSDHWAPTEFTANKRWEITLATHPLTVRSLKYLLLLLILLVVPLSDLSLSNMLNTIFILETNVPYHNRIFCWNRVKMTG